MDTEGRKERVREAEKDGDICTTMCKIDSQWKFAVWLRELRSGLCNNLEESGAGKGREAQQGGDMYIHVAGSCCWMAETNQYCEAIILQLKINKRTTTMR